MTSLAAPCNWNHFLILRFSVRRAVVGKKSLCDSHRWSNTPTGVINLSYCKMGTTILSFAASRESGLVRHSREAFLDWWRPLSIRLAEITEIPALLAPSSCVKSSLNFIYISWLVFLWCDFPTRHSRRIVVSNLNRKTDQDSCRSTVQVNCRSIRITMQYKLITNSQSILKLIFVRTFQCKAKDCST